MGNRWLAVTWAGGGNVGPLVALAAGLTAREHQVAAVATPSLRDRLSAAGLAPIRASAGWLPGAEELLEAIEQLQPDALIVDYMLTGALCGASAAGLPTVVLVHTLFRPLLVDGAPFPIAMCGGVEQVNETRSRLGMPPITCFGDLFDEVDLVLVCAPEELDGPGPVRKNLVYAGLLSEPPPPKTPWTPPPGPEPLVVVSLGTAMSGGVERETLLLRRVSEALSRLPVRAVINLPDYIPAASIEAPANVTITGYVPHAHLLAYADLLVTHGGLGSVSTALAHGVPMVCLPLDRDQPANARAVERIGAGLCLEPESSLESLISAFGECLQLTPTVQLDRDPAPALAALESVVEPR